MYHARTVTGLMLSATSVSSFIIHSITKDNISFMAGVASCLIGACMLYLSYRKHRRGEREAIFREKEFTANINKLQMERDLFACQLENLKKTDK